MAVSVSGSVYAGESSSSSALTIAVTVPAGSNRLQTVGVVSYNAKPTSVVFNATETHTEVITANATLETATLFRRIAPTETTANVVVNFAAGEEVVAGVINLTGADQTTPIEDSDSSVSLSTVTTTNTPALTSQTGGLCIDVLANFNPGTFTVGAGQTERWKEENGGVFESGIGSTEPGAASVTMSQDWTLARIYAHVAMAVAPASAGQTITCTGIATAYTSGAAQFNMNIAASAIVSIEAFGTAKLNMNIVVSAIASFEAFGVHSVSGAAPQTITIVDGVATGEAIGAADVSGGLVVGVSHPQETPVYLFYERLPERGYFPGMVVILYVEPAVARLYYWDHVRAAWVLLQ